MKKIERWFETEIWQKGVQPDAKILVAMVRSAIQGLSGEERGIAVRKYVDLADAQGEECLMEVLESEEYDDNEYTMLGPLTLDYYAEIEDVEAPQQAAETKSMAPGMTDQARELLDARPEFVPRTDMVDRDSLPIVMPTEQRGTGLQSVQRAIKEFIDLEPLPSDAPFEAQRERAFERQRRLEESSVEIAIDRWRSAEEDLRRLGISTALQSRPMGALMWQWYSKLLPVLEAELVEVKKQLKEIKTYRAQGQDERSFYGPLLESLPMSKVAANTILYVMTMMSRGKDRETLRYSAEIKFTQVAIGLAKALEAEAAVEDSKRRAKEAQKGAREAGEDTSKRAKRRQQRRQNAKFARPGAMDVGDAHLNSWPSAPKVKLGAFLLQTLLETAQLPVTREHPRTREKITQMQPAFLHRLKYVLGKRFGYITPNPALLSKLQSEPVGALIAKRMPMVVEPEPWRGWSKGGYLHYPSPILRLAPGDKSGRDYFTAADRKGELDQLYAGLTALGKVPWKVHAGVLRTQLEAWNTGEEIANFAPLHPKIDVPPAPAPGATGQERRNWLLQCRDAENKRSGLHSKRCFQNFQLEIARAVVNETLYFPHNLDFRGRAYPIPPYLNHMGADNVRGLLVFAKGKKLGKEGLRWLKIHLATVSGNDKVSLSDRVKFAEDNIENIRDSVANPLGGKRWWLKAEDAWQTLAACYELTAALDSPNPEEFVSHIPVQQDGTCNGLQHYAALGGDEIGARQVNLEPGDKPADVYTAVAEAVKEEVRKDALAGDKIAMVLDGRITRKCVKQPVMTNVYGVTFYGAKEQVRRQLETIFPEVGRFDEVNHSNMSLYIAKKIFKSLGEMFRGAQAIQNWLGVCADRIAMALTPEQVDRVCGAGGEAYLERITSENNMTRTASYRMNKTSASKGKKGASSGDGAVAESAPRGAKNSMQRESKDIKRDMKALFRSTVVWTTPLRLPVVQPYRKTRTTEIKTNLQTVALQEPQVWDPVSKRKQLQAFPPNFIHSLDATHMLLCALKSTEDGMTFASIHDSFWTHAGDVDKLSVLLRDAFVEMHKEDIIGRLKEEFEMRYKGCVYLASVAAKSPVGERITEWRKQMKGVGNGKVGELALEKERLTLLASDDAEERKKGAAMVTPGSILAAEGNPDNLLAPSEMAGTQLGAIPTGAEQEIEARNSNADEDVAKVESPADLAGDEAAEQEGAEEEEEEEDEDEDSMAKIIQKRQAAYAKSRAMYPRKIYVWMPMEFPDIPEKGTFDVMRLKASRYFFH